MTVSGGATSAPPTTTSKKGQYVISNLEPGTYTVTADDGSSSGCTTVAVVSGETAQASKIVLS